MTRKRGKQRWNARVAAGFVLALMLMGPGGPGVERAGKSMGLRVVTSAYGQDHGKDEQSQVWTCSMHPQIRLPHPGKCPICGMTLIPVSEEKVDPRGQRASLREISLSPTAQKLAEVQVSPVERKAVEVTLRMVGMLTYDERKMAYITSWISGRLDKLYVDFTGTTVKKGQPMVYLYSPELLAAQSELIHAIRAARDLKKSGLGSLRATARQTIESAREKLRLWGLSEAQINDISRRGVPSDHMTILAPLTGTVVHKRGFEGMYVKTGTRIYTIADLSSLWLKLDAYESDLSWIRLGDRVRFETETYPGEEFTGTVTFIDPFLDEKTRTIKVRVDVANPKGRLRPGMFARAVLHAAINGAEPPLVIPATAPLLTGKRAVVYVAVPGRPGTFQGREVVLGPRADRYYVVRTGLREGEQVVTRGNFKIDSAVQILAKPSMMTPEGGGGGSMMHHGGMKGSAGKSKKKMKMTPGKVMKVPEAFHHQLQALMEAFGSVRKAVAAKDWPSAERAYASMAKALNAVNGDLLEGHSRMVWDELSMLLTNDLVVAREAKRPIARQDAFQSLAQHLKRLMAKFGSQPGAKS